MKSGLRTNNQILTILEIEGPTPEAEKKLRANLVTLRSAMDHLEDGPSFERAHEALDVAGRIARRHFSDGCHLEIEDDETYYQACPVALAHSRVGLSPGMIVRNAECSICKADPEDCEHITGRVYDGVRCLRVIKEADILEFSFVARPNQPDARIMRMSVGTAELSKRLGSRFKPGIPVLCDYCMSDCDGVSDPFLEQATS